MESLIALEWVVAYKCVHRCQMWLFISKDMSETPSDGDFPNKSLLKRWQMPGGGGILNRCLGREVRLGRSNPDRV